MLKARKKQNRQNRPVRLIQEKTKRSAGKANTVNSKGSAGRKSDVKKLSKAKAYQILGLKNGASEEEIRNAYDSLILQANSEEQVRDVKEAYNMLTNSLKYLAKYTLVIKDRL